MLWNAVDALGNAGLALGAMAGGLWAIRNSRTRQREEAANWMSQMFLNFYSDPEIAEHRHYLEYPQEAERTAALFLLRVANPDAPLTQTELRMIRGLDKTMNYLEHLLYLKDEGRVRAGDLDVVFAYWLGLFGEPYNANLRAYLNLVRVGYPRLARQAGATAPVRVLVPDPLEDERWSLDEDLLPGTIVAPSVDPEDDENGQRVVRDLLARVERGIGYRPELRDGQTFRRRIIAADDDGEVWAYCRDQRRPGRS